MKRRNDSDADDGEMAAGRSLDILLVGIGGYGALYVEALDPWREKGLVSIRAVVDPLAERSEHWPRIVASGIPCFDSIEPCLNGGGAADLAIISSPIAFHAEQTCAALAAGVNVLCEKPMAATVADAFRMRASRDASGLFLEIGFDWSFSEAIQRLKTDVIAGRFGAPRRARTWIARSRRSDYFGRNGWAGRIRDGQGRWVFDSPANNATAHYLHNMLYVLGPSMACAATPAAVTAECYRANPIENFDAACCRVETTGNLELLFFTAHCVKSNVGPCICFEFEDATVEREPSGAISARFKNGRTESYGCPVLGAEPKLRHCLARCRTPGLGRTLCGPEAATALTECVNAMQRTPIYPFEAAGVRQQVFEHGATLTYVPGLEEVMRQGYERGLLFSEMQVPWAGAAQRVALTRPEHSLSQSNPRLSRSEHRQEVVS